MVAESRIRIEEGSVKVITLVAHLLAADVRADLTLLPPPHQITTTGDPPEQLREE
jgi:hypothetical protein